MAMTSESSKRAAGVLAMEDVFAGDVFVVDGLTALLADCADTFFRGFFRGFLVVFFAVFLADMWCSLTTGFNT
jgi:hypothetical protein